MEGLSSEMNERIARDTSFLDVVFSWSLTDVFNDNFYTEKVKKICDSFETIPEYFSSYVNPLLEETRAALRSSLEIISRAPYAEIVQYDPHKRGQSLYDIQIDEWRNRFNDRGNEPYKTLPGDIFVIVKSRPESIYDLQVVAQTWVLASVIKISKDNSENEIDDNHSSTSFRVKASKDIEGIDDSYSSLFLVFLMNITTNKRIWNALHMHKNVRIIKGILQRNVGDEGYKNSCGCGSITNNGSLSEVTCMELYSSLNPSQYKAVLASVQALQCEHISQVQLVWGPPGTGKTKTLGNLLYVLRKMNIRTLICAPTNIAITEVASRLLELSKNSSPRDLGGTYGFLGDLLLFGNKQRLRVDIDVEGIYLDHRVKRLAECFAPLTGWRSCLPFLANFLEDCVSQYDVYRENELVITKEEGDDKVDATRHIESFLTFLRNRYKAAVEPVRQCISIFCTHASKRFIGEQNFNDLISLILVLESFQILLLQDDLGSDELVELFSSEKVEGSPVCGVVPENLSLLETRRRECISLLRTLHRSLGVKLPNIMNKDTLADLCFQMASLIFCTASSSYKLYNTPVEPLSILVIDEAAQLKECESAIPLQLPGLRHAILFGDECQLPAVVNSKISQDAGFGRSLFQRLSSLGWPKDLLNVQYRMHPAISSFPNVEFYMNQILDAPNVKKKSYKRQFLPGLMYGPYSFINISDGREEVDDDGRSRRNMVEAAVVAKILHNLYKTWRQSTERLAIGVITPYAAQVVTIEDMIGKRYENLDNFGVKVNSVDGFQGGEEDIIIMSTVKSNNAGGVGFLSSFQRTNVALTRARHCLWVLGNERTLLKSDSIWKKLVSNAQQRNCFFNSDEDKSLTEAIIDIKKEMNQLDDLLNKDSILFKSARWKVLFSDNFVKSFSKLPSIRSKKSVMNLLVKLSNGWRPKKAKADPVCESTLKIVKQYKVEGRYVICTNDIVKESQYIQVLKIWDIVSLEDVPKLVRRLDNVYGAFTDDFLYHCKELGLEGDLEVPRTWSNAIEIVRVKRNCDESTSASDGDMDSANYAENAKVSESLLLMKFYSLSAGLVGHLLTDSDGKALDLPFEVTDEEMQIILHQKSSFIVGRSGTGKTTVLTMKLFQKEQLHHLALEGLTEENRDGGFVKKTHSDENGGSENVLRQLFVTVSPKLCYAIKQHVSHLKSFARNESSSTQSGPIDVDDIDDSDQFGGIPDSFYGVPSNLYPLVLTFNKFLLMLDGTIGSSYFERHKDGQSFFCGENLGASSSSIMKLKEVTYERFCSSYWPHFNLLFTKKLDSSRVFVEIISVIKGGLQVGETESGKLSLHDYLHLSVGRTSTLSRQKREMIYDIFLAYERMKSERGEFDLSDFVNDLHRRLRNESYCGDVIDFLYIDEVQDLTMRQIALFKYICRNVDEGFVFSGDTAQTIARGIDFRFQDVRCLFYKEFLSKERNDGVNGCQTRGQMSPIAHLRQNFRTHAGVLKLGHSVIQLIYHFFPHSIDILDPETSLIFGEAPILLESGSNENAIVTIFGNAGNMGGSSMVGFGAEQVILVRDDSVRKEILSYVGKNALVLTIVECKGLEFQDVLLYNFFGSSPLKNQWRVIYEYMKIQNLLDSNLQPSFPNFNSSKHNVLCSELKQLYVAITRTRQRLWICENKEDLSKPMFDYWKKLCVVQVRELDDSLARAMQVASSPEEWKARGKKLLGVENYEVATMCFERAGDRHWETYAKAAGLKASADRTCHMNHEEAYNILRQAAELFESIHVYRKAAECFFELKDYDRAGRIYFEQGEESDLRKAGTCFTLAGQYERAAEVFAKCNQFSECLSSCTKGKLYDLGLQYIQYWKQQEMDERLDLTEQEFLENCARSLYEHNDKISMMKFVKAFRSEEAKQIFLRNLECFDELLDLEVELGNFKSAADIARERGDFEVEADLLEKGGLYRETSELLLRLLLAGCLWADGKGWPLKKFPQMEKLLWKAKTSASNFEPHDLYKTVCAESLIFLNQNTTLSQLKQLLTLSQSHGNLRGEILSTKRILDLILKVDVSKFEMDMDIIEDTAFPHVERISRNKVSVETLIYFWNSWKGNVMKMLKFLAGLEVNETSDFEKLKDFCLSYLGVRKLCFGVNRIYVCLYPDAEWMKEVDRQKFGKVVRVDLEDLLAAARNHWCLELLSTGLKVLKVLDTLRNSGWKNSLSDFCKTRLCFHIYEVAQLLFSGIPKKPGYHELKLLQGSIGVSVAEHFEFVFPVDQRKSVSHNNVSFRESVISWKILEEVIVDNLQRKDDVTYGQLGRAAMVLLGSPKGKVESSLVDLSRLESDSPWKSFLQLCSQGTEAEAPARVQLEDSLAFKLQRAVRDAYGANWRSRDFMSPSCFLYMVDRLMVSLLEFQGYLLITRSSLVEWYIHHQWKANGGTNIVYGDKVYFLRDTFCFLAQMLHGLLMNKRDTVKWILKVDMKEYIPLLVLRLVVLLCLLHLNSNEYLTEFFDVLHNPEITRELPPEFLKALWKHRKVGVHKAFAEALNAIQDPLVVVRIAKVNLRVPGAISLDIANQCKEDLLSILKVPGTSCHANFPQKENERFSEFKYEDGNVWEVFDTLKLIVNKGEKNRLNFVASSSKIKLQVSQIYTLMTTALTMATEKNTRMDEHGNFLAEGDRLLLELQLLLVALDTSGQQLQDSMLLIEDCSRKLLSGKPVFEYFLSSLVPRKDASSLENDETDVAEEGCIDKEGDDDVKSEVQESSSSTAATGKQEDSQGGQKNQGKSKKQAKKRRGKKK